MNFTIYNKVSGKITMSGSCQDINIQSFSTEEEIIPVASNCEKQYVKDGLVFDMPPKPCNFYVFDYETKEWILDITKADALSKLKRKSLLAASDWTQLPDVPLETKQAWATYRQALRDITTQEGYPFNVIWPTKPE